MSKLFVETPPPIGLRPQFIILEERLQEISEAIGRYLKFNETIPANGIPMPIPSEWIKEYNELVKKIDEIRNTK